MNAAIEVARVERLKNEKTLEIKMIFPSEFILKKSSKP